MIPFIGEIFALLAASCYAFGSVAAAKNSGENGGRGNAILLSVVLTAALSGGLWLLIGGAPAVEGRDLWIGIAIFAAAGILSTVLGRLFFFRSIELAGAIETGLIRRLIPVFAAALAILFLGETLTAATALAFALVLSGVVLAVLPARRPITAAAVNPARAAGDRRVGRALATASAASYGGSYVVRKAAMQWVPDPLLGTFVGAVTAFLWFAAAAPVSAAGRRRVAALLRRPSGWQLVAAAAISVGQTAQFLALSFTTVTVVAIIGTLEMFLAAWLAAWVLRTEARPGATFVFSSVLATAGVITLTLARA